MSTIFKKLQLKEGMKICIIDAPVEFERHLESMVVKIRREPGGKEKSDFILVFVKSCDEIKKMAAKATATLKEDGLPWFAYPKKSSKKYKSDISRDDGWQPLGDLGFEGVTQIAIDDDWSALRYRHTDYIGTLKRDPKRAMSSAGKKRTSGK